MPMRIGFTDFRKQMLEEELKNVEALLPQLGVKKVILTGAGGDEIFGGYPWQDKLRLRNKILKIHDREAGIDPYHP